MPLLSSPSHSLSPLRSLPLHSHFPFLRHSPTLFPACEANLRLLQHGLPSLQYSVYMYRTILLPFPSYSTLSTMRLLLLSSLIVAVSCTRWEDYDVLSAHGGVFKALPWTTQELIHVSSLHSRAEYHKLMYFIKEKLVDAGEGLTAGERRAIERFLVVKRPPHVVEHLFEEEEKQQIDQYHSRGDVTDVLSIWSHAMQRLPDALRHKIVNYLTSSD